MPLFRVLLVVLTGVLLVYTAETGLSHGWNLFPEFFGAILAMGWPGQFNLDFTCLLLLSGLWIAWRHGFSGAGIALGLLAAVGGTVVLAPYLLVTSFRVRGDAVALLVGEARRGA